MHAPAKQLTVKDVSIPAGHKLAKLPVLGLVIAVLGGAASAVLALQDKEQFFFSYLVAFVYWLSIALGGLFFVILQHATKAGWSVVVRRVAEVLMAALPYLAVLFVPVILGMHTLYHHWIDAELVAADPVLQHKAGWLNHSAFIVRVVVYFVIWAGLGRLFFSGSVKQDETGDHSITARLTTLSYPAIALFGLSTTFASFDWIMSLDPHWYSTIFGVYFFAGCVVAAFATMILITQTLQRNKLLGDSVTVEHLHDLGKLLFAFVVFWTYMAFSQYMLMWYANIPEETVFYRERGVGGWEHVTLVLAIGHFVIPFFFLLSRMIKRNSFTLALGCLWLLAMHFVDLFWVIAPNHHEELHLSPLDVTTWLAVGGVFVFAVGRAMTRHALVPVKDPRLPESLAFENV
jgi:hypothetical protein